MNIARYLSNSAEKQAAKICLHRCLMRESLYLGLGASDCGALQCQNRAHATKERLFP